MCYWDFEILTCMFKRFFQFLKKTWNIWFCWENKVKPNKISLFWNKTSPNHDFSLPHTPEKFFRRKYDVWSNSNIVMTFHCAIKRCNKKTTLPRHVVPEISRVQFYHMFSLWPPTLATRSKNVLLSVKLFSSTPRTSKIRVVMGKRQIFMASCILFW